MAPQSYPEFAYQALLLVLTLSLPTVLTAAAVGLFVAVLQAATQINDQSIGQAAKLIAVVVVLVFSSRWAAGQMYLFADHLFTSVGMVKPDES